MDRELEAVLAQARTARIGRVDVGGSVREIPMPFPSPADWRDVWIYFLMVDRFNNPNAAPRNAPYNGEYGSFQGGTIEGVRQQLGYLQDLGVGALWLSPVLKNCQFDAGSYHGYGIQDFLRVDPRFCSNPERARNDPEVAAAELRRLVDEAHGRGLYVILDIVLNHTGDVFEYSGIGAVAPWRDDPPYPILWRDADGRGRWTDPGVELPREAAVWPPGLRQNAYFRRRGNAFTRPPELVESAGDFYALKELVTDYEADGLLPVRSALIDAYAHAIAKFDVDGFRIDTLKFLEPDTALCFGNAMREYALSIGKKNFFTFGEVADGEDKIAGFIGRRASTGGDLVGVDAALDFPLFYKLPGVAKGQLAPSEIVSLFERRKEVERDVISSHGEATRFFVTFFDNHDQHERFYYRDTEMPARFDDQLVMAIACLFSLQGIPCIYYGTEQGLCGRGDRPEAVREALWGKPGAFDPAHPFARALRSMTELRSARPALRYGRQYFRPISGDGASFATSTTSPGVLAYSRVLDRDEVVVVANAHTTSGWRGTVIVDRNLNPEGDSFTVLYSNKATPREPDPVVHRAADTVSIDEIDGSRSNGPVRTIDVTLRPMEIQLLGKS